MGRKSTFENYRGKTINGVKILENIGIVNGRLKVSCKCIPCGKIFEEQFHNVYRGGRRSCGCLVGAKKSQSPRWKGFGEIGKSYFNSLERGAKSRGLDFEITLEFIWKLFLKQQRKCAISGETLKFSDTRLNPNGTASLDRKNPKFGYLKDNVQWVHQNINYMKQDMDDLQFIATIKQIYEHNFKY